jgi:hypothetical protein
VPSFDFAKGLEIASTLNATFFHLGFTEVARLAKAPECLIADLGTDATVFGEGLR